MDRKIRVLIAKPGLDGHDRGAKVIARALRDAGMEVIYTGLRQTPEMIAEAALQEDVDVIGMSILSGAHLFLVPKVIEAVKKTGLDGVGFFVGGIIPDEDAAVLKAAGVHAVYGPGTSTETVIQDVRTFASKTAGTGDAASGQRLESRLMDVQTPAVGDRLALTRLISEVENDQNTNLKILDECYRRSGRAHLIGVTGAPGTGKSSLVNRIARLVRSESKKTVAIVAVDPSSPFSGGAILGDRVRMRDLVGDEGVFIRSMASRGELGGLARATAAVVRVLDAAGFDLVLIETVGAGQSEIEIARLAHTTIVVECPGMGDDIQAVKAGILEIADILAVNKADLPGAETTERILRANLELGYPQAVSAKAGHGGFQEADAQSSNESWRPPVIKTVATEGTGVPEVIKAISQHRDYLEKTDLFKKRDGERLQVEFEQTLSRAIMENWRNRFSKEKVECALNEVLKHQRSPASAVKELLES